MMRTSIERSDALARLEAERDNLAQSAATIQLSGRAMKLAAPVEGTLDLADQRTLISALAAERDVREQLQEEVNSLRARLSDAATSAEKLTKSDAALRLAIAKLGRDLVRTFEHQDESRASAPTVDFARTEPTA